jgi:ribosomal protein S30
MRIQRLTLRLVPKATAVSGMPSHGTVTPTGQVVALPPIPHKQKGKHGAKLRRPSVLAMQMGLVQGPQAGPDPIGQVRQCAPCMLVGRSHEQDAQGCN